MASTAIQEQTMSRVTPCPQTDSLAIEETTSLQTWLLANAHGTSMTSLQWAPQVSCGTSLLGSLKAAWHMSTCTAMQSLRFLYALCCMLIALPMLSMQNISKLVADAL